METYQDETIQLDFNQLKKELQEPNLKMASEKELPKLLNAEKGGVSIFHLLYSIAYHYNIQFLLDETLLQEPTVIFHPLSPYQSSIYTKEQMLAFLTYIQAQGIKGEIRTIPKVKSKQYQKKQS